jgi:hypothetical protein
MCNALNHPRNCSCGWGGKGYSKTANLEYPRIPLIGKSIESYTIPNCSCSVCGALIFFYRSPNGGAVFFDELGPPWPKHGCLDGMYPRKPKHTKISEIKKNPRQYRWQSNWEPLFINLIKNVDRQVIEIKGTFSGAEKVIYMVSLNHKFSNNAKFTKTCLWQIKEKREDIFALSIMTESGDSYDAIAYSSSTAALNDIENSPTKKITGGRIISKGRAK